MQEDSPGEAAPDAAEADAGPKVLCPPTAGVQKSFVYLETCLSKPTANKGEGEAADDDMGQSSNSVIESLQAQLTSLKAMTVPGCHSAP